MSVGPLDFVGCDEESCYFSPLEIGTRSVERHSLKSRAKICVLSLAR